MLWLCAWQDNTYAYDEFVSAQSRYIRKQTEGMVIRWGPPGGGCWGARNAAARCPIGPLLQP